MTSWNPELKRSEKGGDMYRIRSSQNRPNVPWMDLELTTMLSYILGWCEKMDHSRKSLGSSRRKSLGRRLQEGGSPLPLSRLSELYPGPLEAAIFLNSRIPPFFSGTVEWWFRNPKANHRLDGAKTLSKQMGISTTNFPQLVSWIRRISWLPSNTWEVENSLKPFTFYLVLWSTYKMGPPNYYIDLSLVIPIYNHG